MSVKAIIDGNIHSFSWSEFEQFITRKWLSTTVEIIDVIKE